MLLITSKSKQRTRITLIMCNFRFGPDFVQKCARRLRYLAVLYSSCVLGSLKSCIMMNYFEEQNFSSNLFLANRSCSRRIARR